MNYIDFIGDMYFYHNIYEVADMQIQADQHETYMYKFSYESEASFIKTVLNIPATVSGTAVNLNYYRII